MIIGKGSGTAGDGISVSIEDDAYAYYDTTGNIIRNNLIAGRRSCFYSDVWADARSKGRQTGGEFIGNTCVGATDAVAFRHSSSSYSSWEVAGNLFWDIQNGASACGAPSNAITFHHNNWHVKQSNPVCDGTGNVYGDPKLNTIIDFRSYSFSNQPGPNDFTPTSESQIINAGVSHVNLPVDYKGEARSSTPTLGALEVDSIIDTVETPSGLSFEFTLQ